LTQIPVARPVARPISASEIGTKFASNFVSRGGKGGSRAALRLPESGVNYRHIGVSSRCSTLVQQSVCTQRTEVFGRINHPLRALTTNFLMRLIRKTWP
jgi:hypothetical protein